MSSRIHPQARTTANIRQEIKDSGLSEREAARVFNISRATAASGSSVTTFKTAHIAPTPCTPR
jgi:hypothetical protein